MSSGSSLFGSQLSLPDTTTVPEDAVVNPSDSTPNIKSKWKTLRDFVDEKAIEDALEQMEEDRNALDVCIYISPFSANTSVNCSHRT